jgi:carbamoyl-phosphate synthase large subunit
MKDLIFKKGLPLIQFFIFAGEKMNSFKDVRVFVSGGAGVVGTVLVEKLAQAGAVIFVGDLKPKPVDFSDTIAYWQGDLNEIEPKELLNFAPQIYFHLAATFERTEESLEFWNENYHHNVQLSHYLLSVLKECQSLQRIVFASSYLIYDPSLYLSEKPLSKKICLKEDSRINPRNLCGMAKLLHEKELEFIPKSTISARIFRVYGKNSRDIISRWIQSLKKGETISVYGKEGSFDYIFAEDVAVGLVRLALTDYQGHINLGSGSSRKITEVLEILQKKFPNMKIKEESTMIPFENSVADMALFKEATGWSPEHSLEQGIEKLTKSQIKKTMS